MFKKWIILFTLLFFSLSCAPTAASFDSIVLTATPFSPATPTATEMSLPSPMPEPSPTATVAPPPAPQALGPNLEQFPKGYNPLTGLPVSDPTALELPALLVSLSHFPPSVRPQTGLSFASQVYEIYITEGMTRFLAVFYGEFPRQIPVLAVPTVRQEPLTASGPLLGNRVWWDENKDGVQQPYEPGLGGVQVDLLDGQGNVLASTFTDGNGYYAFSPAPGQYALQVHLPTGFSVTAPQRAAEALDSDAEPTGRISAFTFQSQDLDEDVGLVLESTQGLSNLPTGNANLTAFETQANVGISGVRSAREAYVPLVNAFPNACLIAASKAAEVHVNICRNVYTSGNVNQAGLSVSAMRALAQANRDPNKPLNYSGNLFTAQPPENGLPASELWVFYSWLNQAKWKYDPVAGAYWRYHDYADPNRVGQFTPALDRLTGRPLLFENVVVLFVEHLPRTSTIIDLNMSGAAGRAIVFRNGQVYKDVRWTMLNEEYERQTGLSRPLRLRYADGTPFPLAPGHTWFHIVTPASGVSEVNPGVWKLTFLAPAGTR